MTEYARILPASLVGPTKRGHIPDRDGVGGAPQGARRMEDRDQRFRVGHESRRRVVGERPFGPRRRIGSPGVHELMLERCLLSKQGDDFGDIIDNYLRARVFGRFDCERFFGRIRVLEAGRLRDWGDGFLAFNARLRETARLTKSASCWR